jgi:hypothetical protein
MKWLRGKAPIRSRSASSRLEAEHRLPDAQPVPSLAAEVARASFGSSSSMRIVQRRTGLSIDCGICGLPGVPENKKGGAPSACSGAGCRVRFALCPVLGGSVLCWLCPCTRRPICFHPLGYRNDGDARSSGAPWSSRSYSKLISQLAFWMARLRTRIFLATSSNCLCSRETGRHGIHFISALEYRSGSLWVDSMA